MQIFPSPNDSSISQPDMPRIISFILASTTAILCGCSSTVNLSVKNKLPTDKCNPALEVSAITKDSGGQQKSTIHLGSAGSGQTATGKFEVRNGGSYLVNATLASGVNVFKGGEKTINADTTDELDISSLSAPMIDPSDTSSIQAAFGQLGANIGFNPITVQSALGAVFGGLVWYVEGGSGTAETQPVSVVPPAQLTGVVEYGSFQWPAGHDSKDATISTDASLKAAASVPLYGSLSANFQANSVYQMHWFMEQFGNVQKTDTVLFQDKIKALDDVVKRDILNRLATNDSRIMYVNSMYVIKSAVLSYKQGQSVSSGASLSGAQVVTASAAYDFSTSQEQQAQVGERVVNIAGPTWDKQTFEAVFCGQNAVVGPAVAVTKFVPGSLSNKAIDHPRVNFR